MNKSKLEILLEEVGKLEFNIGFASLADAYQAYMEERKTIPQQGQEIEVRDNEGEEWVNKIFIGFTTNGLAVTESINFKIYKWHHYRIQTQKKKWKVVKGERFPFVLLQSDTTDLPTIITFED